MTDTVTILRSRSGVLTKRIGRTPDGWRLVPFTSGAWYEVHERTVADFAELAALLERVARDPRAAIVRGACRPGVNRRRCRRLSDRAEHGDAVTFEPCARRSLAVDVDGLEEPPGCTFAAEPEDGIEHALGRLPEPFQDASCWWQATSSAGIKPGIRCRLWFWLSRPVDDAEAKGWLQGAPADRSLYTPVALHYLAAPILESGTPEPVVRRHGRRQGLVDTVEVPAELPRVTALAATPVNLDGKELSREGLEALAAAALASPLIADLWSGKRAYPDRSSGHFAFAAALVRAGCRDANTIHDVLLAWDDRHGRDLGKLSRAGYAARTIGRALALRAAP